MSVLPSASDIADGSNLAQVGIATRPALLSALTSNKNAEKMLAAYVETELLAELQAEAASSRDTDSGESVQDLGQEKQHKHAQQ